MVVEGFLVALDHQYEFSPAFLHDRASGLHLGMERIHQGDGSVQVQPLQQRLARRNLVAFVGNRLDTQRSSAARVDGSDQLGASAPTHGLAIEHHHVAIRTAQSRLLPRPDRLLERQHQDRFEHSINAILRRNLIPALAPIEPASKRCPLSR